MRHPFLKAAKLLGFKRPELMAYAHYLEHDSVDEHLILLESRHGSAFEGNMFYIARHLLSDEKYRDFKLVIPAKANRRQFVVEQVANLPGEVRIVRYGSAEYLRALACSKYLFTDTSFLHCFYKRPEQVYVNTWHGTPLKHLGRSVDGERVRLGNVQRNFLCADYLLFPNEFTKSAIFKDYMLDGLFRGKALLGGYPRNEVFYQQSVRCDVRRRFGLENKRVYAYMPTYRGVGNAVDDGQTAILSHHLSAFDRLLNDDEVLFLNLHPFMEGTISCEGLDRIFLFPKDVPAYDFLAAADGLITDYSSVMFDYAGCGRPIALFTYDLEEYRSSRGTYFDVMDLGLPMAERADGVLSILREAQGSSNERFVAKFCPCEVSNATDMLLRHVIGGESCLAEFEVAASEKTTRLVLVDGVEPAAVRGALERAFDDRGLRAAAYYLSFSRRWDKASDMPRSVGDEVNYYALGGRGAMSFTERIWEALYSRGLVSPERYAAKMRSFYQREWQRRYGNVTFDETASIGVYSRRAAMLFVEHTGQACLHIPEKYGNGSPAYRPSQKELDFYRSSDVVCVKMDEQTEEELATLSPSAGLRLSLAFANTKILSGGGGLKMNFLLRISTRYPQPLDGFRVTVGEKVYNPGLHPLHGKIDDSFVSGRRWFRGSITIKKDELTDFSIQNYMKGIFVRDGKILASRAIAYDLLRSSYRAAKHRSYVDSEAGLCAFFRQSRKSNIAFTVRNINVTDAPSKKLMLKAAWLVARIVPAQSDLVLVFEKDGSKYEESGRCVYEYLRDRDYGNVFFVLDDVTFDNLSALPERYRENMIVSHTFRHYVTFFRARTFIGTESMSHSLELRVQERHAIEKLKGRDCSYVFLQHGVMYMVSLDSPQRAFFRRGETRAKTKIVVNSKNERNHFVELGGFKPEDTILCGLPKFDRSYLNPSADKIVIMPTWRAWEFNEARIAPESTAYWRMIQRIREALPSELEDKVVVQCHPLFDVNAGTLGIRQSRSIDELLRDARVLITDYSSVAYDAFYRGSNVIFYWEEKDACMDRYGAPTHLMIDECTAPGFVCYSPTELASVIRKAYECPQSEEFRRRYQEIVSFHDGRNTERLVNALEDEGILRRGE